MGNIKTVTSPSGLVLTTTYDLRNRQKTVNHPASGTVTYTYVNDQLSTVDSNGNTQTMAYDAEGNLHTQIDAMGNKTTYDNGIQVDSQYPNLLNKVTYPTMIYVVRGAKNYELYKLFAGNAQL